MSKSSQNADSLDEVLDQLDAAAAGTSPVSVREVHEAIGRRAYGPLLVVPALGALTLGIVPGLPTVFALAILLIALQLVFGKDQIWLPRFLLERELKAETMKKAISRVRPAARIVDRLLKPRLQMFAGPGSVRVTAAACAVLALAIPPMEFLPFAVFAPSAAIIMFGLGLLGRDGLFTLIAFALSALAVGLGLMALR